MSDSYKVQSKDYRVTIEMIEDSIASETYHKLGTKMTACVLTLKNGHEVVGLAGVVDPSKYDISIGSKYAREDAVEKLWPLFGYAMQIQMHHDNRFYEYPEEEIILDEEAMKHRIIYPTLQDEEDLEFQEISRLAEEFNNCCQQH